MKNKTDREIVIDVHEEFDWDNKVCGKTLKEAGQYLIDLADKLPEGSIIEEFFENYYNSEKEIRVVTVRKENDEEYLERMKIYEEEEMEREKKKMKRKKRKERIKEEKRKKDEEEFKRLKDKLGY